MTGFKRSIHTPRLMPEDGTQIRKSKQCEKGQHYSRCLAKYCTCECHKTGH